MAKAESSISSVDFMLDLQGANGQWKKHKALDNLERRSHLKLQQKLEADRRKAVAKARRAEKEESIRRAVEERVMLGKKIREQARIEQERLLETQMKAAEEQARVEALEAQRRRLLQPRACNTCGGSGKCIKCDGLGATLTMYLSSAVNGVSTAFHGRTETPCCACGGRKDGGEVMEFKVLCGDGKCVTCGGCGQIRLGNAQVEEALAQMDPELLQVPLPDSTAA